MSDLTAKRKLAAIFYADVAGYSRLTSRDELGTHRRVMKMLDDASESIEQGDGNVLRYAGDAILAEFPSIVLAVEVAVSIQTKLAQLSEEHIDDNSVKIRIGLNLGEVLQDRGEIYGDGVNLAARLESAAIPGGICISDRVFEQIRGKIDIDFENGGIRIFKNFEKPIHIFQWHPTGVSASTQDADLPLPDKPSIAVLPFDNMSSDPEQEFFSDGVTEDIITELSRERDLFVIARNSTFAYKGKSPDVGQVARELGVKFILEGSVRKAGSRIRLNAQLIDAQNNSHVWAERYDRSMEDVFEVQDELTQTISNTLLQKFRDTETERALRHTPQSIAAYDHYLRAFGLISKITKKGSEEAVREARKALEIEPDYARAFMVMAWTHAYRAWSGWTEDPEKELALSREAALKAVNSDKDDFWSHGALAFAELFARNHERALNAINRAVALNPNSADSHAMRGAILNFAGDPVEALEEMKLALRLNPNHPTWYLAGIGRAHYLLGQYEQAIPYIERLVNTGDEVLAWHPLLIASYMAVGREDEARAEVRALLAVSPDVRCENVLAITPFHDEQAAVQYTELLKTAGLPE